jgi:hypothetical protein
MLLLSRLQPLPPLLLSLLPLLLAAGSARAVAAERRPGPGSRLLLKLNPPRTRSKTRARVRKSDNDEGYGDLLQKRAEIQKRHAAEKYFCFKTTRKSKFSCV